MTPDYPYIPKSLDTITPISADMGGCRGRMFIVTVFEDVSDGVGGFSLYRGSARVLRGRCA